MKIHVNTSIQNYLEIFIFFTESMSRFFSLVSTLPASINHIQDIE